MCVDLKTSMMLTSEPDDPAVTPGWTHLRMVTFAVVHSVKVDVCFALQNTKTHLEKSSITEVID